MSIEAGNILREAREQKGVSIKDASDSLHIRIPYLQALENGRAEIIPSTVQARGFLRIYAEYLGISANDIIQEWDHPGSTQLSAKPDENADLPNQTTPADQSANTSIPRPSGIQANSPQPNTSFPPGYIPQGGFPPVQNMPAGHIPVPASQPTTQQPFPPNIDTTQESETDSEPQKNPEEKTKKKNKGFPKLFTKKAPETKPEPVEKKTAQELFSEIGQELAFRRKFLSLSLEDCESQTLIRSIYLESIENGNFEQLPSLIQARGMLNNYSSFLDLDVDAIMLKFATALQLLSEKKNRRDEDKKSKPSKKAGRLKKFFTPDLFVGIFVIVGIAGIIIYSAITITAYRKSISVPTPDLELSLLEQYLDTTRTPEFLPTLTQTPTQSVQTNSDAFVVNNTDETESEEVTSSQPVQLFVSANQRALMRVVSDGKEVFSGRTIPNNTYPFDAENEIELNISNGDAISVVYNQQNLGRVGNLGEVMTIIFSPFMAATPTPQFSPTPTNTFEPTYTPQPETPLPTNTPTPYIP